MPGDETTKVHYVYDGWNRLVAVYDDDSGEPDDLLSSYEYDGLGRRIEKAVTAAGGGARDVDYFYDESWRLLESRQTAGAVDSVDQYVWDVTYIDAPILRFHDGNADGDLEDAGDTVRYFTWDANHNVTAALEEVDSTWQVVERYVYSPTARRPCTTTTGPLRPPPRKTARSTPATSSIPNPPSTTSATACTTPPSAPSPNAIPSTMPRGMRIFIGTSVVPQPDIPILQDAS